MKVEKGSMFKVCTVVLMTALLGACNGGGNGGGGGGGANQPSASVDSNGNCTSSFIGDYNSVVFEGNAVAMAVKVSYTTEASLTEKLRSLSNACAKFFGAHSNVSCKAEVNYQTATISSADHREKCDKANELLNAGTNTPAPAQPESQPQPESQTPVPAPTPIPAPAAVPSAEAAKQTFDDAVLGDLDWQRIRFKALDLDAIKTLVASEGRLVVVGGKVGKVNELRTEIMNGQTLCSVGRVGGGSDVPQTLEQGTELGTRYLSESARQLAAGEARDLTIKLSGGSYELFCAKLGANGFLVKDLRQSVKGLFEVSIAPESK